MKGKKIILTILTVSLCVAMLCGCSYKKVRHKPEEYILETEYKKDFKILQLNDIHLANKDNRREQYDFLDGTITMADPDMIIMCGDLFTFADRTVAKELFAFMDSYGIPWTLTFGNHDEQCYFPIDWVTGVLNEYGSNCLFKDIQDDDVFGNANFAINLMDGNEIKKQIIMIDSNRYNYGEYIGYDYIKQDQIDWYERLVDYTTKENGGEVVKSLAFFHIPLPEFATAWDEVQQGGSKDTEYIYGGQGEPVSCPKVNSGLFDKMLELGSTEGIFVAHDHVTDFIVKYKGIILSYGVNSTDRIYYDDNLLGGRVITIHEDGSLDFNDITHSYEEVE